MSLTEFFQNHIHASTAATAATAATTVSPMVDWFSRAALGITVGVVVWIVTHILTHLLKKCGHHDS